MADSSQSVDFLAGATTCTNAASPRTELPSLADGQALSPSTRSG